MFRGSGMRDVKPSSRKLNIKICSVLMMPDSSYTSVKGDSDHRQQQRQKGSPCWNSPDTACPLIFHILDSIALANWIVPIGDQTHSDLFISFIRSRSNSNRSSVKNEYILFPERSRDRQSPLRPTRDNYTIAWLNVIGVWLRSGYAWNKAGCKMNAISSRKSKVPPHWEHYTVPRMWWMLFPKWYRVWIKFRTEEKGSLGPACRCPNIFPIQSRANYDTLNNGPIFECFWLMKRLVDQ